MAKNAHLTVCARTVAAVLAGLLALPAAAAIQANTSRANLTVSLTVRGKCTVDTDVPAATDAVHCSYMTPYRSDGPNANAQAGQPPHAISRQNETATLAAGSHEKTRYFTIQY